MHVHTWRQIIHPFRYDREGDLLVEQGRRISINNGVLSFSTAMKADEGIITCVATNSIRNSSASISLRVLGKHTRL